MQSHIKLTLLEKSRALPIGTRKIRGTGDKMHWSRKGADGKWKYDGPVSPSERAAEEKRLKTKQKAKKFKEKSKKKRQELEQTKDKLQTITDDKPSAAELAKMPKSLQLYWDDTTSKTARELCDKTGILCLDQNAETYLSQKLGTVFKLTDEQQSLIDGLDPRLPGGTKIAWIDDPLFIEDTVRELRKLRELYGKDNKTTQQLFEKIRVDIQATDLIPQQDVENLVHLHYQDLLNSLDDTILNLEQHQNDKVVMEKLRALEKGLRGLKTVDTLPESLILSMLGDFNSAFEAFPGDFTKVTDNVKQILATMGIENVKQYDRLYSRFGSKEMLNWFVFTFIPHSDTIMSTVLVAGEYKHKFNPNMTYNQYGVSADVMQPVSPGDPGYIDLDKLYKPNKELQKQFPVLTEFLSSMFIDNTQHIAELEQKVREEARYSASLSDIISELSGKYILTLNPELTWRKIGNTIKNAMRSKTFQQNTKQDAEYFKTITDTAKILGKTSLNGSSDIAAVKVGEFIDALSPAMQKSLSVSNASVMHWSGTFAHKKGYWSYSKKSPKYIPSYGFIAYDRATVKKGTDRRKNVGVYGGRSWTYEKFGETKALKGAMRHKVLSIAAIKTEHYGRALGANTHASASITAAIGANWQNRVLAKKSDIIPEWKWGQFMPHHPNSIISLGYIKYKSTTLKDAVNASTHIQKQDYVNAVINLRNDTIIGQLGLSTGHSSKTKQAPKVVLKTNKLGTSEWQKKILDDWTHPDHRFRKGSMEVKHVFDIMYPQYQKEFDKIENEKDNTRFLYHGTDFAAAGSIIKGGYIVPRRIKTGRSIGDGVYTTPSSSKALGYLKDHWGRYGTGTLFLNKVSLGNMNKGVNDVISSIHDSSYDTTYMKGAYNGGSRSAFKYDEMCVKNPKAVIPTVWMEVGPK